MCFRYFLDVRRHRGRRRRDVHFRSVQTLYPDRIQIRCRALAGPEEIGEHTSCLRISGIDRINRPVVHRPITQCNANKEIIRYDEEEIRTNSRRVHIYCVCGRDRYTQKKSSSLV